MLKTLLHIREYFLRINSLITVNEKRSKYDIDCNIQQDDTKVKSMKVNFATIQSSILKSLEGIGSWTKLR